MEVTWVAEKVFFTILFIVLLGVLIALTVRLNNSAKRTKLLIPYHSRILLIVEVVFLAGCIMIVLFG